MENTDILRKCFIYVKNMNQESTIKTARRVFQILEYLEEVKRPVSLKEVTSKFGYPNSSGSALLKSLVTMGYLFYDVYSRTYLPTMRISQMGRWLDVGLFGETAVLGLADFVHEATDEMVSISAQSDLSAQYIHTRQSTQSLRFEVETGTLRPLARSGIGRVILSTHTDIEIERLLRKINANMPEFEHATMESLAPVITQIRRDGFYFSKSTFTKGLGVIAMPLPGQTLGRTLVLGVGGPLSRLEENERDILRTMRAGIAKYLTS